MSEVARIRAEMDEVARKAGYQSRQAMIAEMRSNPKYFPKNGQELMQAAASRRRRSTARCRPCSAGFHGFLMA